MPELTAQVVLGVELRAGAEAHRVGDVAVRVDEPRHHGLSAEIDASPASSPGGDRHSALPPRRFGHR